MYTSPKPTRETERKDGQVARLSVLFKKETNTQKNTLKMMRQQKRKRRVNKIYHTNIYIHINNKQRRRA